MSTTLINMVKAQETVTETAGIKLLNLTPVKHGYTPERHPTKKQKGSKPTHDPPRKLKISVRDEATEDLSFEQSPEIKSFKEMVAALQKDTLPSSDSEATTTTTSLFQIKYSFQSLWPQLAKAIRGGYKRKKKIV